MMVDRGTRIQLSDGYLSRYRQLCKEEDRLLAKVLELQSYAGVHSPSIEHITCKGTPDDRTALLVASLEEAKREHAAAAVEASSCALDLVERIGQVGREHALYGLVLQAYYVSRRTWGQTARELEISESHTMRLRNDALDAFYRFLPNDWKVPHGSPLTTGTRGERCGGSFQHGSD